MAEKNSDRVLDLILGQLEKLNDNQEKLSDEIQKTNLELQKISGFKQWKEDIEKTISSEDLKKMKEFYSKNQDIEADVSDLYLITKELRNDSDDYKKIKTKTMTILAVIAFLFSTALTILGIFAKWH